MILFLFYLIIRVSLTASEFRLLHDQRVPPWTAYYSSDLEDCSKEGLLRNFPEIYGIKNESYITIGPPHNFVVTPFEREALELGGSKNFYYPGAQISFFPPEIGTENITGYEVRLYKNRGLVCIIMDFTDRNWPSQRQIELELFPLFGLTHYQLSIASLPRYDGNQRSNLTDLVTGVFGSYRTKDSVLPPSANWYASVAYDVIDEDILNATRSLEVVFSRPPPDYNFQSFEIILVPKGGNSDIRRAKTSNLYTVFEGVPPGNYRIMMWPVDAYFSQTGRCLCRLADGACSNCVSTVVDTVIIT